MNADAPQPEATKPVPVYLVADDLKAACKHCATFSRGTIKTFVERQFVPEVTAPTATVTFIEFEGRCYTVTAFHVVDEFDKMAKREDCDPEGYAVPVGKGLFIQPPFVRPATPIVGYRPDIALCPMKPEHLERIGKRPYRVARTPELSFPVPYALAVGFPTTSKSERAEDGGVQLELPCVWAVAEGVSTRDADQIQFFSEIVQAHEVGSLSGMSGGPVFWSDGVQHGLLGFVKEAMDVVPKPGEETLFAGPRVNFICERASYDTLGRWIEDAERELPRAMEAINDRVRQRTSQPSEEKG